MRTLVHETRRSCQDRGRRWSDGRSHTTRAPWCNRGAVGALAVQRAEGPASSRRRGQTHSAREGRPYAAAHVPPPRGASSSLGWSRRTQARAGHPPQPSARRPRMRSLPGLSITSSFAKLLATTAAYRSLSKLSKGLLSERVSCRKVRSAQAANSIMSNEPSCHAISGKASRRRRFPGARNGAQAEADVRERTARVNDWRGFATPIALGGRAG